MAEYEPPVRDFDSFTPITMSIIGSYNVETINLRAVFIFLPVTSRTIGDGFKIQKKQGKICLPPELNTPGEILSMRFEKQVRGIVRSEESKGFPHSIIIDIGTSDRIVSVKLSKSLKLTGPRSMEIGREAVQSILDKIIVAQDNLNYIRENIELAWRTREAIISGSSYEDERMYRIMKEAGKDYPQETVGDFLEFMIRFDKNLYTGTLEIEQLESEMVNIQYNLGFSVNRVALSKIFSVHPFISNYNTVKQATPVNVCYQYTKCDLKGKKSIAQHTIRVTKNGHVRHSGPNLEAMRPVYYAFMQRVLLNWREMKSFETDKQKIKLTVPCREYTVGEWREFIQKEKNLRQRIIDGEVPIAQGEVFDIELVDKNNKALRDRYVYVEPEMIFGETEEEQVPLMKFNYSPLM